MQFAEKLSYLGVVLPRFSFTRNSSPRRFEAAGGLIAHWHDTWPEDTHLPLAWNCLARQRRSATTFHSVAWQSALARPFVRAGRFRLLTIWDDSSLVGVFPFQLNANGQLESLGSMISDYLDPLVSDTRAADVWESLMLALRRVPNAKVHETILHNVRLPHLHAHEMQAAAKSQRFCAELQEVSQTACVPLAASWDEYLAKLGGHDRKEIRRKLRNAQTKAGAEFRVANSVEEVAAGLELVFDFMKQVGGAKGMKARWTYRPLFRRATVALVESKRITVSLLKMEGRDVAGLISFPSADGPQLWAAGYDSAASKWSPGIVLFALAMQRAIAAGETQFDLLRGQCRYKSELGAIDSSIHQLTLRAE